MKKAVFITCIMAIAGSSSLHAMFATRQLPKYIVKKNTLHPRHFAQSKSGKDGDESIGLGIAGGATGTLIYMGVGDLAGRVFYGRIFYKDETFANGCRITGGATGGLVSARILGGKSGMLAWSGVVAICGCALAKKAYDNKHKKC